MRSAVLVATLVVCAVVLTACGTGNDTGNPTSAAADGGYQFVNATSHGQLIPVAQRQPAADVRGTLISGGGGWRLSEHRGHVVLVNFWASWCAPCRSESPMLEKVYRQLHGGGVDFVGVDIKDERQAAQAFIAQFHMTYPMVYDEPAKLALALGIPVGGLPVTTLIDRAGRVAAVYIGEVHRPDITAALGRLAGEPS